MRARILRTFAVAGVLALGATATVAVAPASAEQGWGCLLPCEGTFSMDAPASVGIGADWSPLTLDVVDSYGRADAKVELDVSADVPLGVGAVLVQVRSGQTWSNVPLSAKAEHLVGSPGTLEILAEQRSAVELRLAVTDVFPDFAAGSPTKLTVKAALLDPTPPTSTPSPTATASSSASPTPTVTSTPPSPPALRAPAKKNAAGEVYVEETAQIAVKQLTVDVPAKVDAEEGVPVEVSATVTNDTGGTYRDVLVAPLVVVTEPEIDECDTNVEGECDFGAEDYSEEGGDEEGDDEEFLTSKPGREALDAVSTSSDLTATLELLNGVAELSSTTVEFKKGEEWVSLGDVTDPSELPLVDLAAGESRTIPWRLTVNRPTAGDDSAIQWVALRAAGPADAAASPSLVSSSSTVTFAGAAATRLSVYVEGMPIAEVDGGPTLPATGSDVGDEARLGLALVLFGGLLLLVTRRRYDLARATT